MYGGGKTEIGALVLRMRIPQKIILKHGVFCPYNCIRILFEERFEFHIYTIGTLRSVAPRLFVSKHFVGDGLEFSESHVSILCNDLIQSEDIRLGKLIGTHDARRMETWICKTPVENHCLSKGRSFCIVQIFVDHSGQ